MGVRHEVHKFEKRRPGIDAHSMHPRLVPAKDRKETSRPDSRAIPRPQQQMLSRPKTCLQTDMVHLPALSLSLANHTPRLRPQSTSGHHPHSYRYICKAPLPGCAESYTLGGFVLRHLLTLYHGRRPLREHMLIPIAMINICDSDAREAPPLSTRRCAPILIQHLMLAVQFE